MWNRIKYIPNHVLPEHSFPIYYTPLVESTGSPGGGGSAGTGVYKITSLNILQNSLHTIKPLVRH